MPGALDWEEVRPTTPLVLTAAKREGPAGPGGT